MSKVDLNKKEKKNALLQTAFELFTDKGFAKTTISDISSKAGLAKGTFYLYFKDKYDLRDILIAHKTGQLFAEAHHALLQQSIEGFENQLFFVVDFIIEKLAENPKLLQFISKNLSWGIFRVAFEQQVTDESEESREFYSYYRELVQESSITDLEAELLLFTILELVGSTCYSCILYEQPLPMEEYMPYLHRSIHHILLSYFNENEYNQ